MVYANDNGRKFNMSVCVNGTFLHESGGSVRIPFDAEYSVRFHNKNNRRAVVKFSLDGEDASGAGYVIEPHSHVDIRRYAHRDAAFRFVAADSQEAIAAGKGDQHDGLLTASFSLEREVPPIRWYHAREPWQIPNPICPNPYPRAVFMSSLSAGQPRGMDVNSLSCTSPVGVPGVTVQGDATGQQFGSMAIDLESYATTVTLRLVGYHAQAAHRPQPVANPLPKGIAAENAQLEHEIAEIERNRELRERLAALQAG